MFINTSHRIKICAYIYFFGNIFISLYRDLIQFSELGQPHQLILTLIVDNLHGFLMYFVLSLIIYGFGKIVECYELLNKKISKEEKRMNIID